MLLPSGWSAPAGWRAGGLTVVAADGRTTDAHVMLIVEREEVELFSLVAGQCQARLLRSVPGCVQPGGCFAPARHQPAGESRD